MRARGEKAIAAYHRAIETGGSTYDKRVKVLLVGQDRVGKTSLGKALRGEPFDKNENSTEGVQMIPAIKNAGTGAWRNPDSLEHTTVFDHRVAAKTAEDLLSTHSEQPAKKRPRVESSNKTDQLFGQDGKRSRTHSFNSFLLLVIIISKGPLSSRLFLKGSDSVRARKAHLGAHWFTIKIHIFFEEKNLSSICLNINNNK